MTAPSWAVGVNPDIHNPPGGYQKAEPPLTWEQIVATAGFILQTFIGRIAVAFGGIDIFGWKPLDFLAEWGQARIDEAARNYLAAMGAQYTANYAVTQVTKLSMSSYASDVTGGIGLSTQFTGAADSITNATFTSPTGADGFAQLVADGAGAGYYALDGNGHLKWLKSGSNTRRIAYGLVSKDSYPYVPVVTTTDYQAIYTVFSDPPYSFYSSIPSGANYLLGRISDDGQTFVWVRLSQGEVAVGKTVSGTWGTAWTTAEVTISAGDQWAFLIGTNTNARQFIVKQNGNVQISWTDSTSSAYGSGYRGIGFAGEAKGYSVSGIGTGQAVPGSFDSWAMADRKPTSI